MDNEERAFMIREARNLILSNLCTVYPSGLAGESVYMVMLGTFPDYTRITCLKDLSYLEEKSYIVRRHPLTGKTNKTIDWKGARWFLTAAGNEVANHLKDDPALEV
jgi:hypothetical protein